jgi:hypothetical protein
MSDLLKVVNPPEVLAYGGRVNDRVDTMFTELNLLCGNVVDVDYHGTNAFAFKTQAGEMASEFAKSLAQEINKLKEGISRATSNIAGSLGGSPIALDLSDNTITPASPKPDDGVQVANPTALSDLETQVGTRFSNLTTAIDGLKALPANDRNGWMGQARNDTEEFVNQWTASAKGKCENARTNLVQFITKQRDSVMAADRA